MSEELLNIAKELSEKSTTELALQFMELTADNIIKGKEIDRLNNIINELEEFLNKVVETGASIEQITCKNILNYLKELKDSEIKENQQKEFIDYLTHELNTSYTNSSRYYYFSLILSKYKEIIGGKE